MRRPPPDEVTGALPVASNHTVAHVWAAVDTVIWRAGVIPGLIYFRRQVVLLIAVSVALNLVAHVTAHVAASPRGPTMIPSPPPPTAATRSRSQLVATYAYWHPFSVCIAIAAVAATIWLAADPVGRATISIAQVTHPTVGTVWLIFCAAGGVFTLAGTVMLHDRVEALGLALLAATLAAQALGTGMRFGGRSAFPILVFAAAAVACVLRVSQVGLARKILTGDGNNGKAVDA
jgi:hypothetical protein